MLQAYLERMAAEGLEICDEVIMFIIFFTYYSASLFIIRISLDSEAGRLGSAATDTEGFELSPEARAQADLKFTYVVTCQIYGKQKEDQKPEAADIALLMQR